MILVRTRNPEAVTVVVSDSSPDGPAMREASARSRRGRGLRIVAALSAHWGWHPEEGGKAVFATLAKEPRARGRDGAAASMTSRRPSPLLSA